jgi:hypothetical protein
MKLHGETYIFFLQLSPRPSEIFFHLSRAFHQHRIRLIPVTPTAFKQLQDGRQHDLIVLTADLQTQRAYLELRRSFLDNLVKRSALRLIEISSFTKTTEFYRQEKKGLYFHFPLPCETLDIVNQVAAELSIDREVAQDWPGGRRSRIPAA